MFNPLQFISRMSQREKWVCTVLFLLAIIIHFYGFTIFSYVRNFAWKMSTPNPYTWENKVKIFIPDDFYLSKNISDEHSLFFCNEVKRCGDFINLNKSSTFFSPSDFNMELLKKLYPNAKIVELNSCHGNEIKCFWVESSMNNLKDDYVNIEILFINTSFRSSYSGSNGNIPAFKTFAKNLNFLNQ